MKKLFLRLGFLLISINFYSKIYSQISSYPHCEDFEAAPVWTIGGINSDWAWGTPSHPTINAPGGGSKSWCVGGLTGSAYVNSEQAWIASPAYDFTNLNYPWVSFKIFWECERQWDGVVLQSSINNGVSWQNVGAFGDAVDCNTANWFNYGNITWLNSLPAGTRHGWSGRTGATFGSCTGGFGSNGWLTAKHCLNNLAGQPSVRFRFLMGSGTTCNNFDGLAFDDFCISNGVSHAPNFSVNCNNFTAITPPCPIVTNYSWNFGDPASGPTNTSALANPVHVFSGPGIYTVSLTTSGGGCNPPATISKTISVSNFTTPPIIQNVSCFGGNNGSATVTVSGNSPFTYTWLPSGGNASTAVNLTAGTYSVQIQDANNCSVTKTLTISQPPALNAALSSSNVSCNGGTNGSATITIGGGTPGYTYNWTPSGGTNSVATGFAAGSYTANITDIKGCTITAVVNIIQPPSLIAVITVSNSSCGFSNGSATVQPSGGTPAYSYSWIPSGGTNSVASNLSSGNYSVIITDAKGCISILPFSINSGSIIASINNNSVSCHGGNNGSATVTASNGNAPYSYTWNPAPSFGQGTPFASGLSSSVYSVTITDNLGCTTVAVTNILQPNLITYTITKNNILCNGQSNGSATINISGGTPNYSLVWLPSGGNTNVASNLNSGTYSVSITDNNGCAINATTSIIEPPLLTSTISQTNITCFGQNNGIASVIANGGTPGYSYAWSPNVNNNSILNNLQAGVYSVTISDIKGCQTSHSVVISQPSQMLSVVSSTNIKCNGDSTGMIILNTSGGTGSYSYSWSPNIGNTNNPSNLKAGNYFVIITDNNNCQITHSIHISEPTKLSLTINDEDICYGKSALLIANVIGGFTPYNFFWNNNPGSNSVTVSPTVTTNYSVYVVDGNGCSTPLKKSVVTVKSPLTLSVTPSQTVCPGKSTTVFAEAFGGTGSYNYTWMPVNINTPSISININTNTVYTVSVSDGCSLPIAISTLSVYTENISIPNIQASQFEGCAPLCITFSSSSAINNNNISNSTWFFSDGGTSNSANPYYCFANAGTYKVFNSITTKLGCVITASLNSQIIVHQKPNADFLASNDFVTFSEPEIEFTNQSTNASSYLWDFHSIAQSTNVNTKFNFPEIGKYLVTLVASDGICKDTAFKIIECKPDFTFFAPNTFTPDNDNLNEIFLPIGEGWDLTKFELFIFDRWGTKIFETKNWNEGWNGYYKDEKVKDDSYIWKVQLYDIFKRKHDFIGHVTILK